LQGKDTDPADPKKIRAALDAQKEEHVCLLNYKKNGEPFMNQFFICPLYDENKKLAYFLGAQAAVDSKSPGQQAENSA
jgi:hypothetical protein